MGEGEGSARALTAPVSVGEESFVGHPDLGAGRATIPRRDTKPGRAAILLIESR